jgi:DNA (cytosine-5)-methyltransferase 1
MKPLLIADLFCGAGGSSTGAEKAVWDIGRKMTLVCINHWPVAIETHKKNHPMARHYVEDVMVADPYKIVPEGYLDLLMASPECRFYSRARGGRPVHDQTRMNPWAIQRWLTSLNVKHLLVENVPEFVDWGPLLKNGMPDPRSKGLFFQSWIKALWEMGYKAEWRFLNAADFGDVTTRIRFFLIARKDGKPICWPTPSHSCNNDSGMFESLVPWRAAREIIDWGNMGRSLLDDPKYQKRPLSHKTLKRIARGLQKFGGPLAPLYIELLGLEHNGQHGDTVEPFVMGKQSTPVYRSLDKPVPTIMTKSGHEIVLPTIKPFIMGKNGNSPAMRGVDQPIPTVTCDGKSVLIEPVAKPFILSQQSAGAPRNPDNPIPTICSDGAISLVNPTMVKFYGTAIASSIDKPVPTVTTKARFGLVTPSAKPFILQNRICPDGDRVYDIEQPLKTATSHGAGALVNPIVVAVNHNGGRSRPVDKPIGVITTKRGMAIVMPSLQPCQEADSLDPRRLILVDGEPYLLDLRFRMLTNLELARAMGFTDEESTYEFVGNISEVTRQIGNAVPVNMAKALVLAIFSALKEMKGAS